MKYAKDENNKDAKLLLKKVQNKVKESKGLY